MLRRFALILVLLSLPLRLWAGAGLMANVAPLPEPVAAVQTDHPCHEAEDAAAPLALMDHCDGSDCRVCSACHMPALHGLGLLDFSSNPPHGWVALTGLPDYAGWVDSPFKPPVS